MKKTFFSLDTREFEDVLHNISSRIQHLPKDLVLANARAINRTLEAVRAEAVRISKKTYTAKATSIYKDMTLEKASGQKARGVLHIAGRLGAPLIRFKPSPSKASSWKGITVAQRRPQKGISSLIKRGGTRKVYGEGKGKPFFATMKNGHIGLFVRKGKKIDELFGPSPIQSLGTKISEEALQAKACGTYSKRLSHEVDALLAGLSRTSKGKP